jgi:N-acetylneuraminic acid mutarotase
MKTFSHLENTKTQKYEYGDTLLKKMLSKVAWRNEVTKNFLLVCERMIVIAIKKIETIETYLRP